ncbi:MAG: ribose 5-phosphate isomerase B [Bacteroidaceae bacterium]|nr:ribose 5-phosphate isomerase B [Bacteroidaceae bacterium]
MTKALPIGLASDHAGFAMKQYVKQYLQGAGLTFTDYGCYNEESCDYPDFAHKLAEGIENGECNSGIGICGSGEGISMTLNKHQGIRAALVWQPEIAHMARLHNDANILVLPGRYMSEETAKACLDEFFNTSFEGGRHVRRIEKMRLDR